MHYSQVVHFGISAWQGFYFDENGVERVCIVLRMGPDEEEVIDAETGAELIPPPEYFKLKEFDQ